MLHPHAGRTLEPNPVLGAYAPDPPSRSALTFHG